MSNPVSSNIHWDRFFFWAWISSVIFLIQVRIEMAIRMVFHTDHLWIRRKNCAVKVETKLMVAAIKLF